MKKLLPILAIGLSPAAIGQANASFAVYFKTDSYQLSHAARARLDSFCRAGIPPGITLMGFCDSRGASTYNDTLSLHRVQAVRTYLLQHGVKPAMITSADGMGESNPVNENKNPAEMALNRRVTIVFPVTGEEKERVTALSSPSMTQQTTAQAATIPSLTKQMADTAVKAGSKIVLQNIYFVGGSPEFLPTSFPIVEELLDVMNKNPTLVIEIEGHICCLPGDSDGYNIKSGRYDLSVGRAQAVMNYLTEHGIAKERVSYKGFGHSMPLYPYPEKDQGEQAVNRRVEIKIVSK